MEPSTSLLEMSRKFVDKMKANEEEMRVITDQVELLAQAHRAEMLKKEKKARSHEELAGHLFQLMRKRQAENKKLATCQELLVTFQKNVSSLGLDDQMEFPAPMQHVGEPAGLLRHDLKDEEGEAMEFCETSTEPVSIWTPLPCRRREPTGFDESMAMSLPGSRKKHKVARSDMIVVSSDESGDEKDGAVLLKELPHYHRKDSLVHAGPNSSCVSKVLGLVEGTLTHTPNMVSQTIAPTLSREPEVLRSSTEAELGSSTRAGASVGEPEAVTAHTTQPPSPHSTMTTEVHQLYAIQHAKQLTVETRRGDQYSTRRGDQYSSSMQTNAVDVLPQLATVAPLDVEQRMSPGQEDSTLIQPPKKKRGRPRKNPLPESVSNVSRDVTSAPTVSLPIKRRPGRPRKYPPKPGQLTDGNKLIPVTASTLKGDDPAGRTPALRLTNYMRRKATGLAALSGKLMGAVRDRLEHVMCEVGALAEIPALVQVTQPADLKLSGWEDVDNLRSAGFHQMFTTYMHEFALMVQENVEKHLQQPKWYLGKPPKDRTEKYNGAFESIVLAFSSNGFKDSSKKKLRDEMRSSVESFVKLYKSHTNDNEPLQAFKVRMATKLVDDWELRYWRYQVPRETCHEHVDTRAVLEGYKALMASGRTVEAAAVKQLVEMVQTKDSTTSTGGTDPAVPKGLALVGKRVKFLVKGMRWFEGDVIHYSYCDGHHVVLFKNDHLKSISLSSTEVCAF